MTDTPPQEPRAPIVLYAPEWLGTTDRVEMHRTPEACAEYEGSPGETPEWVRPWCVIELVRSPDGSLSFPPAVVERVAGSAAFDNALALYLRNREDDPRDNPREHLGRIRADRRSIVAAVLSSLLAGATPETEQR